MKEVNSKIMSSLEKIPAAIEDVPNVVPSEYKTTFNFKGRKSPYIAQKVIETIMGNKGILFDPFAGSGAFIMAGQGGVDEIYATELDNYTYNATKALFEAVDLDKLKKEFDQVSHIASQDIMDLYETECCGEKNYILKLLYDPDEGKDGLFNPTPNREIQNGHNIKLLHKCPICGNKTKHFDMKDYEKLQKIESIPIKKFPVDKYIENSRINITASTGADKYDRIFSHRNKVALLKLQEGVSSLNDSPEKDILEHVLVSSIALARIAMYGSSTDILYHVVGHGAQDMNVWQLFKDKFDNFCKFKNKFEDKLIGNTSTTIKFSNCDYADYIDKNLDSNIDVIYTDFPYTDQVPYLERNQLFRIWLEKFYDKSKYALTEEMLEKEIVLTNAPARKMKGTLDTYYNDIDNMFKHFYKALKENGLVMLTMKLGKAKYFKTFIEIINLARKNGFEYVYQIGIEKNDPTMRKQSAFLNTFTNEMIVAFVKLKEKDAYWYIGNDNYEYLLVKLIYSYIIHSKDYVTLSSAIALACNDLKSKYSYIATDEDKNRIADILRSNFTVDEGIIQIDNNKLYLEIEDETDLFTKLYDLIPIYVRKLIKEKGKFVLEDIYFELVNSLCDGNPKTIAQLLDNEAHQREIESLIKNYCVSEEHFYIERRDITKPNKDAVDISTLSGTDFEIVVKRLLMADGYEDVIVIGGAGDLGVDLIATKNIGKKKERYLFQCKRWVSNVGSDPIQRLFAERERRHYDKAICVTTSGYTKDGINAAKDFNVGAVDGEQLMIQLDKYFSGEYYNGISEI